MDWEYLRECLRDPDFWIIVGLRMVTAMAMVIVIACIVALAN